jgi:aspartyl-tRNA synthetase
MNLRLLMGSRLGLRNPNDFKPVWVVDFPLLEKDEQTNVIMQCITHLHLLKMKIKIY